MNDRGPNGTLLSTVDEPEAPSAGRTQVAPETPGGRASLSRLVVFTRPVAARLGLAVLAGAAALGCAVGLIAASAWLISRAAQHPPVLYLMVAIVSVRAFGLGRGVFRYLERLVSHDAAFRVLARLRVQVYRRLERIAPAGLPTFRSGDLLGRLVSDVDDVQDVFLRALVPGLVAVVVGGGSVALVWLLLPAAGAILLAALVLAGVVVPWLTARLARRTEARLAERRGELSAGVVELLHGAPELVAYGVAEDRLAALARVEGELTRAAASSARTAGIGAGLAAVAPGLAVVGALLVGVPAVRAGTLDPVLLAVVVLVPLAAFEAVAALPLAAQQLQRARSSTARVMNVIDAPAPVTEPLRPRPLPEPPHHLRATGLRVRWPAARDLTLAGVDVDLPPGRRVAVVGPSGAGKSTLAAVLLRFLDAEGGSVTLDGVPTAELSGEDVRRVVGLCGQDAHLFDSTIRENIRLARPDASQAQLLDVVRRAGLAEWVAALPDGLDTPVGEHGARVSGGQRQRIALARALLADFPILLLDEPTANLDPPTADALTADLLAASAGRATLLITHRLVGLDAVDEILVLEGGRVTQRGTHDDLVARAGWYQNRWRSDHESIVLSG